MNLFEENFSVGKIFKKMEQTNNQNGQSLEKLLGQKLGDGSSQNSVQNEQEAHLYYTDLLAFEKVRLMLELLSLIFVSILVIVPADKVTKQKLSKKSEIYKENYKNLSNFLNSFNLANFKESLESLESNTNSNDKLRDVLTKPALADLYSKDLKDVKNFDYDHSEKVVYQKIVSNLQVNFNRLNKTIKGLEEKLQYYS